MRKIQSKITLTYLLLTLLVVTCVGLFASIKLESYFKDQMVETLGKRADAMMYIFQQDGTLTAEQLDSRVTDLARLWELRITLIDRAGSVLADSDIPRQDIATVENHLQRPEVQQAIRRGIGADTRHSATIGQDFLYLAKVVEHPANRNMLIQRIHVLRLSVRLSDIQKTVGEIRSSIFIAGTLVLLIVLAVSVLVSRRISQPMVAIAEAVKQIRSGNLETRVDIKGSDETAHVAQAVNEMVAKLKSDIVQLKKLERVRSEFLGNVSHELRTPIFSLQGFLETLLDGAIDDPNVNKDFVQKAYAHATRLNTLLGELITISQIESGEMKMSFRYFNLHEFLHDVVEDFRPASEQSNVHLTLQDDLSKAVDVLGDKERLRVVFENLLDNATKYNQQNGEVVVGFAQHDGEVIVHVRDTGVGIAPEHHSRVFERFYRVDRNRSRDVGGTGLGLAIVKHIVEAHGSKIDLTSEPGKGSTFSFNLRT